MSGWISISRDIFDHEFFKREPMSEREAWVWMLARAAWKDTTHRIGGETVTVPRGSFFCTLRELQSAWGWASDKRVRSFLKRTQERRMTDARAVAGKTQVSICNYDEYQSHGRSKDASEGDDWTQERRTKEQDNNKQDNKRRDTIVSLVDRGPNTGEICVEHFNAVADTVGWPKVQKLTKPRIAALAQRVKDVGGIDAWKEAIDRAARSQLLTGQRGRGWKADFDWLQKPANFTKLMEGNYDDGDAGRQNGFHQSAADRGNQATIAAFAAVAARYSGKTQ